MSSSTDSSRGYDELYQGWIRLRKILQVHHWKLKYILYQLRVSGEGKLGDEMELPLVDPRDPNYDSDRHEAVVKISTLNSLIPLGSGIRNPLHQLLCRAITLVTNLLNRIYSVYSTERNSSILILEIGNMSLNINVGL